MNTILFCKCCSQIFEQDAIMRLNIPQNKYKWKELKKGILFINYAKLLQRTLNLVGQ
jgi:hypothetical protein